MKKVFAITFLLVCTLTLKAQDSCYVYTYLHWFGSGAKHQVQLTEDLEKEGTDFVNEAGETLVFKNFMGALNYAIANGKWEVYYISTINPFNGMFKREQYAILRKRMAKTESVEYRKAEPKNSKK